MRSDSNVEQSPTTDESSIEYDFDSDKKPSEIIDNVGEIVSAVDNASEQASSGIGLKGRFRSKLDSMENGSVIVNLRHEIDVSNFPVVDTDLIFQYTYNYISAIQNIFRNSERLTLADIRSFRDEMSDIAAQIKIGLFTQYSPPSLQEIAGEFLAFQSPMSKLWHDESCVFRSKYGEVEFSKKSITSPENNLSILTTEIDSHNAKVNLLIKKPDLLGASMWELIYDGKTITASIRDKVWLKKFQQQGEIQSRSGILVDLQEKKYIDVDGKLFKTEYFIDKVYSQTKPEDERRI